MNALQEFKFNNYSVRVILIENKPYWCAIDVCRVLGYSNGPKAVKDHCKEKGITKCYTLTVGGNQQLTYIDEGNVIRLVMRSELPEAEKFQDWIHDEVIPQIFKTGSYGLQIPKSLPEALRAYAAEVEAHEKSKQLLIEQQPKVELANQCLIAVNSRSVGDTAKVLGIGRNTLFQFLRDESILMQTNVPYQKYMLAGWFEVKFSPKEQKGVTVNYPVTMVLPKGLEKIRELLNRKQAA